MCHMTRLKMELLATSNCAQINVETVSWKAIGMHTLFVLNCKSF